MGILALGMVMVASMFPVAWDRARRLSEHTVHKTTVATADAIVKSLARVTNASLGTSSFTGDIVFDINGTLHPVCGPNWPDGTDSWVHALNLENIQVESRQFVDEDPWKLERAPDLSLLDGFSLQAIDRCYLQKQISFHQRVQPPLRPRNGVTAGVFTAPDDPWDDELDSRRFVWAVFHRVSTQLQKDAKKAGTMRFFDVYYVTLRRGQPTYRYARQDPTSTPNPCYFPPPPPPPPVVPVPLPRDADVMFPVAWRVQVELPVMPELSPRGDPSGIPTEIVVPPLLSTANDAVKVMLVQMFPPGAQFIDEVSGQVYRVVKQRLTGAQSDQAFLTLDREMFIEDVDLPPNDIRCDVFCTPGVVDAPERLRTVWVFPPPVQPGRLGADENVLVFEGSPPVVNIAVRSLRVKPSD